MAGFYAFYGNDVLIEVNMQRWIFITKKRILIPLHYKNFALIQVNELPRKAN